MSNHQITTEPHGNFSVVAYDSSVVDTEYHHDFHVHSLSRCVIFAARVHVEESVGTCYKNNRREPPLPAVVVVEERQGDAELELARHGVCLTHERAPNCILIATSSL